MQLVSIIVTLLLGLLSSWTLIRVARIEGGVAEVGRAVKAGAPTLVQRVAVMEEDGNKRWDWTCESVVAIGREVGAKLQPPPERAA